VIRYMFILNQSDKFKNIFTANRSGLINNFYLIDMHFLLKNAEPLMNSDDNDI